MNGDTSSRNGPIKQLSAESLPIFQEGIFLVLSRWSSLQLAIENEWGGRGSSQLANQLSSNIFSWFTQTKEPLYIDDLENILDEGMLSLNAMIEDGSIEEVAEKLMIMHEECLEGNLDSIEKLRQAGPVTGAHQHVRQAADDDDEDEDSDDDDMDSKSNMMVDAPKFQSNSNEVNKQDAPSSKQAQGEDGWTVVSSRKSRVGNRN